MKRLTPRSSTFRRVSLQGGATIVKRREGDIGTLINRPDHCDERTSKVEQRAEAGRSITQGWVLYNLNVRPVSGVLHFFSH